MHPRSVLTVVLAVLGLTAAAADAQVEVYPARGERGVGGDSIRLVGNAGEPITVVLVGGAANDTLEAVLTPFSASSGGTTAHFLGSDGTPAGARARLAFGTGRSSELQIVFDSLSLPQPYVGAVVFALGGEAERTVKVVVESAAHLRNGTLTVGLRQIERSVVVPPWGTVEGSFDVTLSEADRSWPLNGLMAEVEEVSAGGSVGFDPRSSVLFTDRTDTLDLWRTDGRGGTSMAAGEVRTLVAHVRVPEPGEYKAKIRFTATNSREDDGQILDLTVRARHPMWLIGLVLLVGAIGSFFMTKVLSVARQQIEYRANLGDISAGFLRTEPPTMAVVRVLATVRRAEELSKGIMLAWRDLVADPLSREKQRLARLQRVGEQRRAIERWARPEMVKRRAHKELRQIVSDLSADIDDALLAKVDGALDQLDQWNDDALLPALYQAGLRSDIDTLLAVVEPGTVSANAPRIEMNRLAETLGKPMPEKLLDQVEIEKAYARLKVLWEWRDDEELATLAEISHTGTLESLFYAADTEAWNRLGEVEILAPGRAQTFDPIKLEVAPKDRRRGDNYLFKHNLTFEWSLEIPRRRLGSAARPLRLTPTTNEPRVVQYVPVSGTLKVKVRLRFHDKVKDVDSTTVPIAGSRVKRLAASFSRIEWIAALVAVVLAVVSGVLMFYVDNPTFGSTKDYLTVLLWALAVEQGKNVVQIRELFGRSTTQQQGAG